MYKELLFLHLFFAILWIGGMIYSLVFMRPALGKVDDNCRTTLLQNTWGRFFYAVWLSIVVLFLTGMALWHKFRPDFSSNTLFHLKLLMFAIMVLNFAYIHLYLFRKRIFGSIPVLMTINLVLGILIVMVITFIR
ncbi:hypothetical protein [Aquifex sp.]